MTTTDGPQDDGPSMVRRLALRLGIVVALLLSAICLSIHWGAERLYEQAQTQLLAVKVQKLVETSAAMLKPGSQDFLQLLQANAPKRQGSRLELRYVSGEPFYVDPNDESHTMSAQIRSRRFTLQSADGATVLEGRFDIDVAEDVARQDALARWLLLVTSGGALLSAGLAFVMVRQGLKPLRRLADQTQQMSSLHRLSHLRLERRSAELSPLVDRFNDLMDRLEAGRLQLEAFNADVAHELRTPLTALIGRTELALSRPRSTEELTQTLCSNLDELARMSSVVNDMLFLARADGGQQARLSPARDLRPLLGDLLEYHEAQASERGLRLALQGELCLAVDERLLQRAVSNLIGNACRYADPGSTVRVVMAPTDGGQCSISVTNQGDSIARADLPRLFDRFYRGDGARQREGMHAGLGLAIVAAVARMHGGQVWAVSSQRQTEVGMLLPAVSGSAPASVANG